MKPMGTGPAAGLGADRRAVASVEAALALALVLLPLLLGLFDLGTALTTRVRLDRAVQAGLFYAWGTSGAGTAAIAQAAVAGYGGGKPTLTASAGMACYCLAPTGTRASGTAVACTDSCPSGEVLGVWLTLTATAPVVLPFPLPGVASPLTLAATSTVRSQ